MNTTIRICIRSGGMIEDAKQDYGPEDFGGIVPNIGDAILAPGVTQGLNRHEPANRKVWEVVGRVFNPHDNANYVVLVVDQRVGTRADDYFL